MPVTGTILAIAMGASARGPLLIVSRNLTAARTRTVFSIVDPDTLALKNNLPTKANMFNSITAIPNIRASANGAVFSMWDKSTGPTGLQTIVLEGNDAKGSYAHESVNWAIPSADCQIIFAGARMYTPEAKRIENPNLDTFNGLRVPAMQGNYYLEINRKGMMEIYVYGNPRALGSVPRLGEISVNTGAVTALQKKEGKLEEIQLDASLNPGNSGGPVLDADGRVIGIVYAKIRGTAVNFAVPVSRLQEFLSEPDVDFIEPALNIENMSKPAKFKAEVLMATEDTAQYKAQLTLTTTGLQRKIPMKRDSGGFSTEEVPAPPPKGSPHMLLSANYGSKSVSGIVADKSFTVAGKNYELGKIQSLEGGSKPHVVMDDGTRIDGVITGLSSKETPSNSFQSSYLRGFRSSHQFT
jgi:hypothetical protein